MKARETSAALENIAQLERELNSQRSEQILALDKEIGQSEQATLEHQAEAKTVVLAAEVSMDLCTCTSFGSKLSLPSTVEENSSPVPQKCPSWLQKPFLSGRRDTLDTTFLDKCSSLSTVLPGDSYIISLLSEVALRLENSS